MQWIGKIWLEASTMNPRLFLVSDLFDYLSHMQSLQSIFSRRFNSWQRTTAIMGFCLASLAPSLAQDCPGLTVEGLWLDPFNPSLVHVICQNTNFQEIYSYPSWHILDDEGNLLGTEEVMYFGIADFSHHVIDLALPWSDDPATVPVQIELWVGFDDELMCSYEMDFVPRELEWTGTGDGGCFPMVCSAFGYFDAEGVEVEVELLDEADNLIWSAEWLTGPANNFSSQSDSMCLSQNECFRFNVSVGTSDYFTLQWEDAIYPYGFSHWSHTFISNSNVLDTTFTLDLYGGDCGINGVFNPMGLKAVIYPNPIRLGDQFSIILPSEKPLIDGWLSNSVGQEVMRISSGQLTFDSPNAPGIYWLHDRNHISVPLIVIAN